MLLMRSNEVISKLRRDLVQLGDLHASAHLRPLKLFCAQDAIKRMQHPAIATLYLGGDGEFVVFLGQAHAIALYDAANRYPAHHRSEEHTSELQSPCNLVCRLLLEKKKMRIWFTSKLENVRDVILVLLRQYDAV